MKVRLQITVSQGASFAFEHQGPALRIGRDPDGELALQGEFCQAVSWNHARLDLTPGGAFITDVGSTNGTLLNDERLSARSRVRLGDRIQLGHTGPVLLVTELDLTPLAPQPAPARPAAATAAPPRPRELAEDRSPVLTATADEPPAAAGPSPQAQATLAYLHGIRRNAVLGLLVAGGCLVLLVGWLWWKRPGQVHEARQPVANGTEQSRPTPPAAQPGETAATRTPAGGAGSGALAAVTETRPPETKPVAPIPPAAPSGDGPSLEVREVGRYVVPEKSPPSVLVQRQRDPEPWGRLRPEGRVSTGYHLVSLPGYRSKVYLDSGVHLMLWGNVPEFSSFPPVLESAVLLNTPPPGFDLDFTLDRGRVHLTNYKPTGPAKVRARFDQEVWDLTLPDGTTEVVLELWGMYPPGAPVQREPGGKGPLSCLGLFTKGRAQLTARQKDYQLADSTRVVWSNQNPAVQGPTSLPKPPDWWTNKITPDNPRVQDVMLALLDYSKVLSEKEAVIDTVRTQVRESSEAPVRSLGVLFLGALDAVSQLIDALEDPRYVEVRVTARHALQQWISRAPDNDLELLRTLQEKKGYSHNKAEIVLRLLHTFSEGEVKQPPTYQTLIGYLNHDNLAIRSLALWHLGLLVPEGAKKIPYDPTADSEQRQKAVDEWKKLIPAGKLPPRG